jgi:hypothetical protein
MSYSSIISVIDRVRETVRQTSGDTPYSDQYIYDLLLDERNELIEREINKRKMRSLFNWSIICMPLIESTKIPCDCVPEDLGCVVLRSKYKIVKPISSLFTDMVKITSIDGTKQYSIKSGIESKYASKYSRTSSAKVHATIIDDYLYIIGVKKNDLPAVLIHIIPEDPTELDNITLCELDGTETSETCFDPTKNDFNIEARLIKVMIQNIMTNRFGISMNIQEDYTNNASSPKIESTL